MTPGELVKSNRYRRYPPMAIALLIALLLAVAILPSALNIPQSNPNTVPEYAPVPPGQNSQTDEQGNLAALGQAGSSGLTGGVGPAPALISGPSTSRRLSGKKCVGNPPRQTEDPMSPPCVAFFEGNNFGATYQGVTKDEITAVVALDCCGLYNVGDGVDQAPVAGLCDVDKPPNSDPGCLNSDGEDHTFVRFTRAFSRYFNDRYQTYDRRIHYWIYWGSTSGTVEDKRANAVAIYDRLKPFAVIDQTIFTANDQATLDSLARRKVMLFPEPTNGSVTDVYTNNYYRDYAPQLFSYYPDAENWAKIHGSYLCSRVAGFPVAHAQGGRNLDGSDMNGGPRKYGFLSVEHPSFPGLKRFSELVKPTLRECGIVPEPNADRTYYWHGALWLGDGPEQETTNAVAAWRQANVTTIIWLGSWGANMTRRMSDSQYYPEIVFAGDLNVDDGINGRAFLPQDVWRNAWGTTWQLRVDRLDTSLPFRACAEGDSGLSRGQCDLARNFYLPHFSLARSIQAAGPRLSPKTVDRGLHAYPTISSNSPYVAACFYDPGDYTCVKDSAELWWDPTAKPETQSGNGCYRLTAGGPRYLAGRWPRGDDAFKPENAPCTDIGYGGIFRGPS